MGTDSKFVKRRKVLGGNKSPFIERRKILSGAKILGVFPFIGKSVNQSGTVSTVKDKKD